MKKRIAFLLIVPLLCVLAASLNISYMPAGGLLFISTCTLDGESFTIRQKTMPDGTKIAVYDGETSIVYAKYRGLTYTITEIRKPADGHWLPKSIKVYRGSYSSPDNTEENSLRVRFLHASEAVLFHSRMENSISSAV